MEPTYSFPVYAKANNDDGPAFQCVVLEDGKSRLVFPGNTHAEAETEARQWANSALNTPERHAKLAAAAQARAEAKARKAKKEQAA